MQYYFVSRAIFTALILTGCSQLKPEEEGGNDKENISPENTELILSTTTSTQDTGLLDIIPFEEQTGYR